MQEMDFFLEKQHQQAFEPSDREIEQLRVELSSHIAKLEQALVNFKDPLQLILVIGHPGSGKSTLVGTLESLELPLTFRTFHVDQYIDWRKVVAYVDNQSGMDESDYVPVANQAALELLKNETGNKKLVVVDGGGLLKDYARICQNLGFSKPGYIVLDAALDTLLKRLESRGDSFNVTEKETREHHKNLESIERYNAIRVSTERMDKGNPSHELALVFGFVCDVLGRTTENQ